MSNSCSSAGVRSSGVMAGKLEGRTGGVPTSRSPARHPSPGKSASNISTRRSGVESGAGEVIPPPRCVGDVAVGFLLMMSPGPASGELRDAGEKPKRGSTLEAFGEMLVLGREEEEFSAIWRVVTEAAGLTKAHRLVGSGVRAGSLGRGIALREEILLKVLVDGGEAASSSAARPSNGTVSPVLMEVSHDVSEGSSRGRVSTGVTAPTMDMLTTTGERTVGEVLRGEKLPLGRVIEVAAEGETTVVGMAE